MRAYGPSVPTTCSISPEMRYVSFAALAFFAVGVTSAGATDVDQPRGPFSAAGEKALRGDPQGIVFGQGSDSAEAADITLFEEKTDGEKGPVLRRLDADVTTCQDENNPAKVTIDEYTLKAEFTCGTELTSLAPACADTNPIQNCCRTDRDADCTNGETIVAVLGVEGSLTKQQADGLKYTVQLDKMPSERTKRMYYKCTNGTNKHCMVTVRMPEKIPEQNVCIPDRPVELQVTKDGGKAEFICAPGGTLEPEGLAEVFTKKEGPAKVQLSSLVPGAALAKETSTGKYTLTVPTLPTEAQELFYTCKYGSARTKASDVKITVAAAPQQSSTTTAATNGAGSALVAAPRFATVAGLALGLASYAALQ